MIIDAAATLPRVPIRQIMIHRQDIVFFSLAETAEVNMVRARQSLHSRLPVCRQGLESVIGLVNMKEVLWRLADGPEELEEEGLNRILGESMRDPLFAPADIDVSDLIQLFATHHAHLAMVKDETDGIVGMVTLEDVVEELMGEIDDEFDRTPSQIESLGEHRMRIGGGVSWARVRDALGMSGAHEVEEDLDGRLDMNDMAAEKLVGRLRTGAAFVLDGWRFKVTRMRRGKVVLVEASKAARREPRSGAPDPASLGPESGVSS
jgi:CBS domain containing-hemolysin-like protein